MIHSSKDILNVVFDRAYFFSLLPSMQAYQMGLFPAEVRQVVGMPAVTSRWQMSRNPPKDISVNTTVLT
jgi:hypothetical protein